MSQLPSRSVRVAAPAAGHGRSDNILPTEESASLPLWAYPGLLGWPRSVNWIISPVVGNDRYPGDLWGLDSRGDLLIVEMKLHRSRRQDPFADFVPYASSGTAEGRWRASPLEEYWRRLVALEERFLREFGNPRSAPRKERTSPGVLPYSRRRAAIRAWPTLLRQRIAHRFRNGQYRRAVERSIRERRLRNDPPPIFVGVIATVAEGEPLLSVAGRKAFDDLRSRVTRRRVIFRALRVQRAGERRLFVRCWTPREATSSAAGSATLARGVRRP